jgi:hypothetical protein
VVFLHLLFKLVSLVLYLFGWFLTSSFIACFILIMLLLSADFWIVKNVTGRLLAGLRHAIIILILLMLFFPRHFYKLDSWKQCCGSGSICF